MNWMKLWAGIGVILAVLATIILAQMFPPQTSADAAAWTQAVLSAAAIFVSGGLAVWVSHRDVARREAERKAEADAAHAGAIMTMQAAAAMIAPVLLGSIVQARQGVFAEGSRHSADSFLGQALLMLNSLKIGDLNSGDARSALALLITHTTGLKAYFRNWAGEEGPHMIPSLEGFLTDIERQRARIGTLP